MTPQEAVAEWRANGMDRPTPAEILYADRTGVTIEESMRTSDLWEDCLRDSVSVRFN